MKLILIGVIIALMLAACGTSSNEIQQPSTWFCQNVKELNTFKYADGIGNSNDFRNLAKDFNRAYRCGLELPDTTVLEKICAPNRVMQYTRNENYYDYELVALTTTCTQHGHTFGWQRVGIPQADRQLIDDMHFSCTRYEYAAIKGDTELRRQYADVINRTRHRAEGFSRIRDFENECRYLGYQVLLGL